MDEQELSKLSDEELLDEFRGIKIDAGIGIRAAANAWGFLFVLPLFLIYLFLKKSRRYEVLKKELRNRNLY